MMTATGDAARIAAGRLPCPAVSDLPELFLFLPQMRLPMSAMVERARAAEAAGFAGIALMDHLAPPMALDQPMHEAMTAAAWLAASTDSLRIGHLVLCDAFRHPAVLAREAVTIAEASGGRFDLGIGSGSVPEELDTFGVPHGGAADRVARLGETLAIMTALWAGETVDNAGEHFTLQGARQAPLPAEPIPIVIGGTGPKMMDLVARYASWWNVPVHQLDRLDTLRERAGDARVSIQQMVTFVADESSRDEVEAQAKRRFGSMGGGRITGTAPELVEHFGSLRAQGVERVYVWLTDFASVDTLVAFGRDIIGD
jgi:alkanesulfonate monooxygenase SsuD/methylene tetrahydromethanopterin reductase-like flavin-dependent oxidoreductase (luciferase family)